VEKRPAGLESLENEGRPPPEWGGRLTAPVAGASKPGARKHRVVHRHGEHRGLEPPGSCGPAKEHAGNRDC